MDNLGEYIRCQREVKKMSLEELSQKTKISVSILQDIERGKFDRYKGDEAYVKMYLKKISKVLDMDTQSITDQYVMLTQDMQKEQFNQDEVIQKDKFSSFYSPQFMRKPSVYEDKPYLRFMKSAFVLLLVCLIVGVVWFGVYTTRLKTPEPHFQSRSQTKVESVEKKDQMNENKGIIFSRLDKLSFQAKVNDDIDMLKIKVKYGNRCWSAVYVNNQLYEGYESLIYEKGEIMELQLRRDELKTLRIRNGYNVGHQYFVNDQQIPLTVDDQDSGGYDFRLILD